MSNFVSLRIRATRPTTVFSFFGESSHETLKFDAFRNFLSLFYDTPRAQTPFDKVQEIGRNDFSILII